jgi:hypothetical protein
MSVIFLFNLQFIGFVLLFKYLLAKETHNNLNQYLFMCL